MKRLKVALLLLLVGVAIAGVAFTTDSAKRFSTANYTWSHSTPFTIGLSDEELLDDTDKWSPGTSATGGSTYLGYVKVVWTGSPAPTEQQMADAVKQRYKQNGNILTNGETWNAIINGVLVTFTVYLKN